MNSFSGLRAIVASSDSGVAASISSSLRELDIEAVIQKDAGSILQMITRQRIDAVFVDKDLDSELSIFSAMRVPLSGRKTLAFAVVAREQSPEKALRLADFILEKPLVSGRVLQTLRASYGLMLKERMRYCRLPLDGEATLSDSMKHDFPASVTNISQTGIALESAAPLIARELVQLRFCLPSDDDSLSCKAQVIWTDQRKKFGLSFTDMKSRDRERLTLWIENHFTQGWNPPAPVFAQPARYLAGKEAQPMTRRAG